MGRATQDPIQVPFGTADPVSAPTEAQTLRDALADTWTWTLRASGGQVSVVGVEAYLWWYVDAAWVRDIRPWNIPDSLLIADGTAVEDVTRARPRTSGVYAQIPSVSGGILTITMEPGRGGV